MSALACFVSLNARSFLALLVLPGVLVVCATSASGSTTFQRAPRSPTAAVGFGSTFDAHGGSEFSLYPTEWRVAGGPSGSAPGPATGGQQLVRLLEGADLEEDADEPQPHDIDQPTLARDQPTHEPDDHGGGLRLLLGEDVLFGGSFAHAPAEHGTPALPDASPYAGGSAFNRTASPSRLRAPANQSKDFVRGMLQRFGVSRQPEPATVPAGDAGRPAGLQRFLPHRFRPHFVSTSKGLRNIPHQLNDGQLQPAPEDAPADGPGATGGASGAPGAGKPPPAGSSGTIGTLFSSFKRKLKAIYPGTVWCGDGNQAKSEDDIGFFYLTDSCCRAHDLCPITIAAGEQFNRLKNNGHFTRSHCDCDKKFFNCLKTANTLVSRQIGYTYFNLLKPQCFRHEHPKLDCTKRSRGRCLRYVVDEQQPKQWQWFDNLIF